MLSKANKTHEAYFGSRMNEVTGKINSQFNQLNGYFGLEETNRQLAFENAILKNNLQQNFSSKSIAQIVIADSLIKDTLGQYRKYEYLPAIVVKNSFSAQNNFITIERGSDQNVKKEMSVVSALGVVGRVVEVSKNYCVAMSLLNRNSIVTGRIKNKDYAGNIEWDGKSATYLIMKNISKSAQLKIGDSVLTGNYSANYPPQLLIGTIAEIKNETSTNSYILKLKTATNFFTLQYVNIIANFYYDEQKEIENKQLPFSNNNE